MNDSDSELPIRAELVPLESFREVDAEIGSVLYFTGYRAAGGSIVKHGPYQRFRKDGLLCDAGELKQGVEQGAARRYNENGKLVSLTEHRDGRNHGIEKRWYDSGILRSEWMWDEDELHGLCRDYHKNGQLREEAIYAADIKNGLCRVWDDAGTLLAEGIYADDLPLDGTFLIDEPVEPGPEMPTFNDYMDRFLNRRFAIAEFRDGQLVRNLGVYPRSRLTPLGSER